MKILIGVDDSPHSEAVVEFVRKMPWPAESRVLVVSAVSMPVPTFAETFPPAAVQIQDLLRDLEKSHGKLAARAEEKLTNAGLRAESRVLQGDPREALIETARAEHADLIVVGSHGRTGLAKLLMGSVASHVVSHAPCSVLVVKLEGAAV